MTIPDHYPCPSVSRQKPYRNSSSCARDLCYCQYHNSQEGHSSYISTQFRQPFIAG